MAQAPHVYGSESRSYSTWEQVAGYFDGDGNVGVEVVKRVLRLKLRFVDTWKPQIESLAAFFGQRGISCSSIGKGDARGNWQPAYRLDIVEVRSVVEAAKGMIGHTVKKNPELRTVVEYLEGRITGNQAIAAFNEAVRLGRRRGKIRRENIPLTKSEGLRISQIENARRAREAYAVEVSPRIQESVRKDHAEHKMGHTRLSRKYGYSVSVIRRILGAP